MKKNRFFSLLGIGGIDPTESLRARFWGRWFDIALFPVAIFALLAWYTNKREIAFISPDIHIFSDWVLWGFFVAELVTLLCLANHRWRYLRDNWFNLVVIIVAMPAFWDAQELGMLRAVRFALVVLKLANLSSTIRVVLSRNNLGLTILAAWIFVFCAGVIMAAIEPGLLAGLVMLLGMGLFSLITANFSAFFVTREELKLVKKEEQVLEKEVQVLVSEQKILGHLQKIEERLHALEKEISQKNNER